MKDSAGIIYDMGNGEFGLALNKDQHPNFSNYGKVFLVVFFDSSCQIPKTDPVSGKKIVSLKHITELRQIGFQD